MSPLYDSYRWSDSQSGQSVLVEVVGDTIQVRENPGIGFSDEVEYIPVPQGAFSLQQISYDMLVSQIERKFQAQRKPQVHS